MPDLETTAAPGQEAWQQRPQPPPAQLALRRLDELPTLAPVAVKLIQATLSPDSDAADVARIIQSDPSMATKLLAVTNSAAFGARRKVTTIDQAVVLLGFKAVRNIALAVKVFECFAQPQPGGENFKRVEFWKHSLAVACAARNLARAAAPLGADPEEAFLAGLLHDLGKIALSAVFPKAYDQIAGRAARARGDIADHERQALGVDHTVAGRSVAERWSLPRVLCEVVWLHHISTDSMPSRVRSPQLIGLVQLADIVAREQRIGFSGNLTFYESSSHVAANLRVPTPDLDAVAARLAAEVAETATALGLDNIVAESLYAESVSRANAELSDLNLELLASNRRLSASARYFNAITRFDQSLRADAATADVVDALVDAARAALQRASILAFGFDIGMEALEVAWVSPDERRGRAAQRVPVDLESWRLNLADGSAPPVVAAPAAIRALVCEHMASPLRGECWVAPIRRRGEVSGGVAFVSERDEPAELAGEATELESLLTSLGLALGRACAYAEVRRLSDDLAETNRRVQQAQSEALRARTLSSIAEMAAGAGHELNSPLFVISGRAELLLQSTTDDPARRSLELIHGKALECSKIVSELMAFARPESPELAPTDLPALLAETGEHWRRETGWPASRLTIDASCDDPQLRAIPLDRVQIRLVLDELILNAVEACSDGGGLTLAARVGCAESAPEAPSSLRPTPPNRWLELSVLDTGRGMSANVVERAFQPFYSHRTAGRRRGLGLARAYRMIEAHHGRVWLESAPGEGTVARIVLPVV